MSLVVTCLLEQNTFYREGLRSILSDSDYSIEHVYPDWNVAKKELFVRKDIDLFLLSVNEQSKGWKEDISSIRQMFAFCHIVVLLDTTAASFVISAFEAGADGCISYSISPQGLIGSLDMAMAGEKVCPAAILNMMTNRTRQIEEKAENDFGINLSGREMEVLRFLSSGESNKQIARNLDISEATVKAHVKAVLRKLSLNNRTQAAIWAVGKGINDQNASSAR